MSILKKENCPICNIPTGALAKSSIKYNGTFLCQTCCRTLGTKGLPLIKLDNYTIDELRRHAGTSGYSEEERQTIIDSFNKTKTVGNYLWVDEDGKKIAIITKKSKGVAYDVDLYNFEDVLDYELIDDGETVTKGGLGATVVGAALFGGVGAIVGSNIGKKKTKRTCKKMQVKITLNSIKNSVVYINLIEMEMKREGPIYEKICASAQEIISILEVIRTQNMTASNPTVPEAQQSYSSADEILKYKQLLDMGAITPEEFEAKKKELLGL